MKIAITSTGKDLLADIEPRFGRSEFFLLIDAETFQYEVIENPNIDAASGAGIQTARLIAEKGAEVILTGHCGPKAFQALQAAGINVIVGVEGKIQEAISKYKAGHYKTAQQPDVESHHKIAESPAMREESKIEPVKTSSVMKIAIPQEGRFVSGHFGRCDQFAIIDIQDGRIINQGILENPEHQPGFLPRFLADHGVNCIICGGMGHRAQGLFIQNNIQVVMGVTGEISAVVDQLLKGTLVGGESLCRPGSGKGTGECH